MLDLLLYGINTARSKWLIGNIVFYPIAGAMLGDWYRGMDHGAWRTMNPDGRRLS